MVAITEALSTGLSTCATDAMGSIATALPAALPIMGAVTVITIGIRIWRKVAH